ncbi:MAG: right-handed parallel beta-helix repeat-containing protein [Clostridiales bacterium]|nr:right-handed parallel beta-helix repeat-containing protein [Clostridiales bacterium]
MPQMPEGGDSQQGEMPEMPEGEEADGDVESETLTVTLTAETEITDSEGNILTASDIKEGDLVTVEISGTEALKITVGSAQEIGFSRTDRRMGGGQGGPENGGGQMGGAPGGGGGQSAPESYDAVTTFTEDTEESGQTYTSTGKDENAVLISDGASVTLRDFTLTRTSDESTGGDSSSFYGIGAGLLVSDGTATISGGTISTDADGGAGIFAYDKGMVYVSDTTITTKKGTSGGIHVAGGGTLYAENLTVETDGASAAAVRSDRGGGTMSVKGGTYTSNGSGSPAVYCTADITIEDAELTATGAEAVCIEGLNSLSLTNCVLTGDMPESSQNDCTWTVILYQSMSGDSEVGNSTFAMDGGSLISENGGLFYTTNTESTFSLKNVAITPSSSNDFFLKCTGNANERGWGQSGANGSDCIFTAEDQEMTGDVVWDSISTLEFTMSGASSLTGAFVQDESCAGDGGSGYANLTIGKDSVWTVTADSVLTSLTNSGTITGSDGKSVTIKGTDGTVYVTGDSAYTITVESYKEA